MFCDLTLPLGNDTDIYLQTSSLSTIAQRKNLLPVLVGRTPSNSETNAFVPSQYTERWPT